MKQEILPFVVDINESIRSAMQKIDANNKGFVIVVNKSKIIGTLTDGDIRRALIRRVSLEKNVSEVCVTDFKSISMTDKFDAIVELFKDSRVKFLPIIDSAKNLINIITKQNLHVLLLQNIVYTPDYPFYLLDDGVLEHEIFSRPWGHYKTAFMNQFCQCKLIHVNPKGVLSLQKHLHREEHWIVVYGSGIVKIADKEIPARAGDSFVIPKGVLHRVWNTSEKEVLIITEVQLGDYFGEDDIIRFEDEYNRVIVH